MKFDNIIIGGGLSGLVAAIESQRAGKRTAIVSAGQSALHFWSGAFEFLGGSGPNPVIDNPLEVAQKLPPSHPYQKIGIKLTQRLLEKVPGILADAGLKVEGTLNRNHYRLTPLGFLKPAWLSLDDYFMINSPDDHVDVDIFSKRAGRIHAMASIAMKSPQKIILFPKIACMAVALDATPRAQNAEIRRPMNMRT